LNHIAELTQSCDQAAEEAADATHTALQTVTGTVEGINAIRATIHETEKRIKRLGERSQEIGRAINLISNIAERTHILALNASMHAAAAGEAGRGFAVVADEVQRLAENARDATQQIATLVTNIQAETNETVATMDNAITQVVAGSRLAGQAGDHMLRTKDSTARLVESVRQIAEDAADQIRLSSELQQHAQSIQDSTRKTRSQLEEQNQHTRRLVQYSKGLLTAVQVFTLPAPVAVSNAAVEGVDADAPKMKAV
jgi:methyl-accepting chemotaxis protein